jgi:hypothetical protein
MPHTPGPWATRQLTNSTRVYAEEFNNAEICSIQRSRFASGPTAARREADARLIAAAPELLAALVQIAIVCTDNMDADKNHRMALDFVRQVANDATAKAGAVS